ncbi:unnamed protein product [Haemonchus placei]|uniref:Stromal cell-derived factor 4 n=1 Tax=Haemonchus placei TaxID=6290 RepID=A0A0N4WF12_HAEPC|nr:unnamed protein product [Haemonchus placei]
MREFSIESMRSNADPLERPVHLDGLLLERDGELNKEFRQENNDGALSLEELEERIINNTRAHLEEAVMEAQSHFNIVDTNKDGQISWQEYEPHYLSNESPKDGHEHERVDNIGKVKRSFLFDDFCIINLAAFIVRDLARKRARAALAPCLQLNLNRYRRTSSPPSLARALEGQNADYESSHSFFIYEDFFKDSVADAVRAFESADLDKDGALDSKEWLR